MLIFTFSFFSIVHKLEYQLYIVLVEWMQWHLLLSEGLVVRMVGVVSILEMYQISLTLGSYREGYLRIASLLLY